VGVDIGISNSVTRTVGTIDLKLFTETHETMHTFHVLGEDSEMHYDAILGKNFFGREGKFKQLLLSPACNE